MKKKMLFIVSILIFSLSLIACNSSTNNSTKKEEPKKNERKSEGVVFTIENVTAEKIKGDSNQNGEMQENGEYFQLGTDLKKASDYKYVVVKVKVENTTDKVVKLFETGWNAEAADGYKFENIKVTDKLNNGQVPSKYSFEGLVKIPVETKMKLDSVNLKYNLKDYSRLTEAMSDGLKGASIDDLKKKYPELYKDNFIDFGAVKVK